MTKTKLRTWTGRLQCDVARSTGRLRIAPVRVPRLGAVLLIVGLAQPGCGNERDGTAAQPGPFGAGGMAGVSASGGGFAPPAAGGSGATGSAGQSAPQAGAGGGAGTDPNMGMPADPSGTSGAPSPLPVRGVIVPSAMWTCGMPAGIPNPETGEIVLEAQLQVGKVLDLGRTQYGQRKVFPIDGGSFKGPKLSGKVLTGGLDWELTLPSGAVELESRLVLQVDGGGPVYLRSCGVADGASVRIVPDFEPDASGPYAWLGKGTYVGSREVTADGMRLVIRSVPSELPSDAPRTTVPKETDATLVEQAWECGAPQVPAADNLKVVEATVMLGPILGINGKNGTRSIFPIIGGTFMGSAGRGTVLAGGADYAVTPPGAALKIAAYYTLRTDDGVLISVRNCGSLNGTMPQFETRTDGPYAFMNTDRFSGTVGIMIGSVLISAFHAQ